MAEHAARLESKNWVPSWFTVGIKTGSLVLHLDYPSCFDAEVFADDIGISLKEKEPVKEENTETNFLDETMGSSLFFPGGLIILVNLGAHVLDAIFVDWVKGHKELRQQKAHHKAKDRELAQLTLEKEVETEEKEDPKVRFTTTEWEERKKEKKRAKAQRKEREKSKEKTKPFVFPPNTQVTLGEVNAETSISRGLYSKAISEFTGKEKLPKWVVVAILNNVFKCRVSSKVSFMLCSVGPGLNSFKRKFTALRLLPVHR
jgi:hypothetical protein